MILEITAALLMRFTDVSDNVCTCQILLQSPTRNVSIRSSALLRTEPDTQSMRPKPFRFVGDYIALHAE